MNGKHYRVKAEHPRRPGQPLVVSAQNADGQFVEIAKAGDSCDAVAPELLESMIANGYVEEVDESGKPIVQGEQ